jgi:hypothetical protein
MAAPIPSRQPKLGDDKGTTIRGQTHLSDDKGTDAFIVLETDLGRLIRAV